MRISRALSRFLLIGCIVGAAAPYSLGQGGGERPSRGGPGGGGMRGGFGGGMMGGFGGGGMASLLAVKEVRDELKMDEEQTKEYEAYQKEVIEEMRAAFGGGRGAPDAGGAGGPGGGGGPSGAGGLGGAAGPGSGGPGGGGPGGAGGGGRGGRGGGPGGPGGMSTADREKMMENLAAAQAKSEAKLADMLDPIQMDRLVGLYLQRDGVRTFRSNTVATRLEISADQKTKISAQETAAGEEMRAAMTPGADFREVMEKVRKDSEEKAMGILTAAQKAKMEELKGAKFEFPAQPPRGGGRGQ